jgi:hypothetical protein
MGFEMGMYITHTESVQAIIKQMAKTQSVINIIIVLAAILKLGKTRQVELKPVD